MSMWLGVAKCAGPVHVARWLGMLAMSMWLGVARCAGHVHVARCG